MSQSVSQENWWWKERRRRYSQLSLGLGLGFKTRRVYEEVLDVRDQFFFLHSCVLSMLNCLQMETFSKQASKHLECLNVQYLVGARRFFFLVVWVCGCRKNLSFWRVQNFRERNWQWNSLGRFGRGFCSRCWQERILLMWNKRAIQLIEASEAAADTPLHERGECTGALGIAQETTQEYWGGRHCSS